MSFIPHSPSLIKEFPATFSDINLFMAYWLMVPGWDPLSKKKESWAFQPAAASHQFPHPSTCSRQPRWMCSPPDTNWIKQQSLNGKAAFAIRLRDRFHSLALWDVPQAATQGRSLTSWPAAGSLTDILHLVSTFSLERNISYNSHKYCSLSYARHPAATFCILSKTAISRGFTTSFFHRNNDHWNMGW